MRDLLILICFFTCIIAEDISKSFEVTGMHCGYGCVNKIKSVITSMDGVKNCEVDFEKSLMTVIYDKKKINSNKIITSLNEKTTYKTSELNAEKKTFWSRLKKLFNKKS